MWENTDQITPSTDTFYAARINLLPKSASFLVREYLGRVIPHKTGHYKTLIIFFLFFGN